MPRSKATYFMGQEHKAKIARRALQIFARPRRRPLDARAFGTPVAAMASGNPFQRRGLLFILSSPSGAGKSTIARLLLGQDDGIALSVSATTRPPRPGEVDGR